LPRLGLESTTQRRDALLAMAVSALDQASYDPQNPNVLGVMEYYRQTGQQDKAESAERNTELSVVMALLHKAAQYDQVNKGLDQSI
jgi:hypothetical protein